MRTQRLLNVTIWLAVTSALVALQLYLLGAPEVAVIELSVGAGLVTVLFVFAFSITGEITFDDLTIIPRPLAIVLTLGAIGLLGWFTVPLVQNPTTGEGVTFARVLWEQRGLDVLAQMVLIFSGVMGLLGLLADHPQTIHMLRGTRARHPVGADLSVGPTDVRVGPEEVQS
jgi:NADH:ubiquinone oxidoreductase subunit 6 (subunit J)